MNVSRKCGLLFLFLGLIFWSVSGCSKKSGDSFLVEITFRDNSMQLPIPVSIDAPLTASDSLSVWEAVPENGSGAKPVYGQVLHDGDSRQIIFLAESPASPGEKTAQYRLRHPSSPVNGAFSFSEHDNKFLTVSEGQIPVFTYVYGMNLKDGVPEDRTRSNYVHPLYDLDGHPLSDDFPADHYHHRGIFIAWPRVIVNGDTLNLWDIRGMDKRFERWLGQETGPVFGRLGVQLGWYAGETKVVDEILWITAFRAGNVGRAIDFDLTLRAVTDSVILIGSPDEGKGYGGFNFRPAPFDNPVITTDSGIQEDSNLKRFPWADFSAIFKGTQSPSGVAIFQNPVNHDIPNGWCLRHYGFLGVAWPGLDPYTLRPSESFHARYRVWIHRGDAVAGQVAAAYDYYAKPPSVTLVR
ncbi:PmoA family protein [bacterium]|nr:PmoA family protein [bacterium]